MMDRFDKEQVRDLDACLKLEWLETNGLGGYAMGTVAGANTRRYHGLLCAAIRPPVDRRMYLSKLEERLSVGGAEGPLSCNLYGEFVHPDGFSNLTGFRLDPWPTWTFELPGATVEKTVTMVHGVNATVVQYKCLHADGPATLFIRPLIAWRDHHHLTGAIVQSSPDVSPGPETVRLSRSGDPSLILHVPGARFWGAADWYYGFTYPEEAARGLDFTEDLYTPGELEWTLRTGDTATVVAAIEHTLGTSVERALQAERERREQIAQAAPEGDEVARTLFLAADQFVVKRPLRGRDAHCETWSVIAGYPWFTDWGRDTMIALPGLFLTTGRHTEAAGVLQVFADAMQGGLVPNMFSDQSDGAAYNTVDATLWFFAAARRYYDATSDLDLFRNGLFGALKRALEAHIQGTDFGIRMDEDGLIVAGDGSTQLTWMDAKVGDHVFTPRHGKAVEINALWYSAIRTAEFFAKKLGEEAAPYAKLGRLVKDSFVATFWSNELGYLYDCVREDYKDPALRPNQAIAVSLPYSALSLEQERSIVRALTEKLTTPYGLRTLSPDDPAYRGRYEGDPWSRDGAYHQGTVWPWLLGPYLSAYLVLGNRSEEAKRAVRELVRPLIEHLGQAGLGTISEVFDGDEPQRPGGCPAQAWSVAELLRVWVENDLGKA